MDSGNSNNNPQVGIGLRIPLFKSGASLPTVFSADDMNQLVKVCNAVLGAKIAIQTAYDDGSGTNQSSGKWHMSETDCLLELSLILPQPASGAGELLGGYFQQSYIDYTLVTANADGSGTLYRVAKPTSLWLPSTRTEYQAPETFTPAALTALQRSALADPTNYGLCSISAVSGNPNETRVVKPRYNIGDYIAFAPLNVPLTVEGLDHDDNGVALGLPIFYMETGTRIWSQIYDQGFTP